jgi:hypothetical protein
MVLQRQAAVCSHYRKLCQGWRLQQQRFGPVDKCAELWQAWTGGRPIGELQLPGPACCASMGLYVMPLVCAYYTCLRCSTQDVLLVCILSAHLLT